MTTRLEWNAAGAHRSLKAMMEAQNTFHTFRRVGISLIFNLCLQKSQLIQNEFLLCSPTAVSPLVNHWSVEYWDFTSVWLVKRKIGPVLHLLIIACEKNRNWINAQETLEGKSNQFQSWKPPMFTLLWKTSEQRNCLCRMRPCASPDWHPFCTLRSVLSGFLSFDTTCLNASFRLI